MNDEIKVWKTQNVKHKVAMLLIMDGVSFRYTEDEGIVFTAPESYIHRFTERLVTCYWCSVKPTFEEY